MSAKKVILTAVIGAGMLLSTAAAEPNWASLPYTAHSAYQAVDAWGEGTFLPSPPIKMKGVILNDPEELLDPAAGAPAFMGGEWQIFIQAVEPGDWGGTACWMGQKYGNLPWIDPEESYTDEEWNEELDRLNHDPLSGHLFRKGDLVEVRARVPGLFYHGKTNINEAHSKELANDFDVYLLQAGVGVPAPQVIPSLLAAKTFDPTRATGGEYYQSTWARINNVRIAGGAWGNGQMLTISDGSETLNLLLSAQGDFGDYPAPTGAFDVLGIFDQDSADNRSGYRLWVPHYADLLINPPRLTAAVSRKTHGSAGEFDLPLPLSEPAATEGRQGGPTTVLLTFSEPVKAIDGTPDESEVHLSAGTLQGVAINGAEMSIALTGVPTPALLTITLSGLADLQDNALDGDHDLNIAVHTADVDANGVVNGDDLSAVKRVLFKPLNQGNFVNDVDCSGVLNGDDLSVTKKRLFQ